MRLCLELNALNKGNDERKVKSTAYYLISIKEINAWAGISIGCKDNIYLLKM